MRTLTRWAALLYPSAWRARYGREMEALLEDAGPRAGDLWDIVRGALTMQMTGSGFWKILAGSGLAGVLAAVIWSATLPNRYMSTAVLRIREATPTGSSFDQKMVAMRHLQKLQQNTLSRRSLTSIMVAQDLYADDRKKLPLEDIIHKMRQRDVRIRVLPSQGTWTFAVDFTGENPAVAQSAAGAIVRSLVEENLTVQRNKPDGGGLNMEVLDPASLPTHANDPERMERLRLGLFAGLGLGLVCGGIWTLVRRREQWSLKWIGGLAVAGMALGLAIALQIPDQFISTAVLRGGDAGQLQTRINQVLSEQSLAAIVRQDNLFRRELSGGGNIAEVVRKMRNENIKVQTVGVAPSQFTAFVVSFRYPDRFVAQRVTRELVAGFIGKGQTDTEVLDPASDPVAPSSPNRMQIVLAGTVAGVLLGLAASRFRRPGLATA